MEPESPRVVAKVDLEGYDGKAEGNGNEKGGINGGVRAFMKLSIFVTLARSLLDRWIRKRIVGTESIFWQRKRARSNLAASCPLFF